ncbi:nuclease EXOG, mitochondrial-like, partial [Drosophila eugracilis]|uniref:nuclease EXOG, mitochondrial-like n=1 Tax=Drosophila eugracilis TaxID=29029 RepID=UPI001BD9D7FE
MSPLHANSFFKGEIYDRFKKIYGERQNYIANGAEVINRGHLTASSDFLFEDQLSSTYKLVNVVPQFASINSGNWNIIERWVQSLPVDDHGLIVRTGAFGVLKLKRGRVDKLAYLIEGAKNPVPAWLYKKITKTKSDG